MNYEDLLISYGSFNQSCGIEIILHTGWVGGVFPIEWQSLPLSLFKYLFIYFWLCRVSIATCGIFHCLAGSSLQRWLSGCGAWASLPHSMWDLSSLASDRMEFPALEGAFLTTGPPGKSLAGSLTMPSLAIVYLYSIIHKSTGYGKEFFRLLICLHILCMLFAPSVKTVGEWPWMKP